MRPVSSRHRDVLQTRRHLIHPRRYTLSKLQFQRRFLRLREEFLNDFIFNVRIGQHTAMLYKLLEVSWQLLGRLICLEVNKTLYVHLEAGAGELDRIVSDVESFILIW